MPYENQCYRWSFTFNKNDRIEQTDEQFGTMYTYMCELFERIKSKYVFQLEKSPTNNRLHYQGHLKLTTKLRLTGLIKITKDTMPGCHFSPDSERGSTNAEFYCIKRDETYIAGPWYDNTFEIPYDGSDLIQPNTFHPWQRDLSIYLEGQPDADKIMWIYQPDGGCGKSSYCKFMCYHFGYPQLIVCKPADLMHLVFTSRTSKTYFIDIQRTLGIDQTMDSLYSSIEQLKNGYIVNTKYITGYKLFAKPHVIVFSNIRPNTKKLSGYKWLLYKIENLNLINENI